MQTSPEPQPRLRRSDRYRPSEEPADEKRVCPEPDRPLTRPTPAQFQLPSSEPSPAPRRVRPSAEVLARNAEYAAQAYEQSERAKPPRSSAYTASHTPASVRPEPYAQPTQQPVPYQRPQMAPQSQRYGNPYVAFQPAAVPQPAAAPEPAPSPIPAWLTGVPMFVVLILLVGALLTGKIMMGNYLTTQQEAREAAYQRVLTAHPMQYRELIEQYAAAYNLQPAFVSSIILNESSFSTGAESGVGARGLMQLMPDTAEWIAHKLGMDASYSDNLLWDAETNIRFGCWYLNYLSKLFGGDPVTVASAYHAGQGEITSWLANSAYSPDGRTLQVENMPEGPTRTYAGRVIRDYAIYDALYFQAFNRADAGAVPDGDMLSAR